MLMIHVFRTQFHVNGFETVQPVYQFIKALLQVHEPDLQVDNEHHDGHQPG